MVTTTSTEMATPKSPKQSRMHTLPRDKNSVEARHA